MEKAAQSAELKGAFAKHRKETEGHVARLEEVFAAIDKRPQGKTCDAILGITEEGAEIMKEYKASGFGSWPARGSSVFPEQELAPWTSFRARKHPLLSIR
jgi:ferritin-like metal-binding protein YciE